MAERPGLQQEVQKSAHSRQNTALSFCREERLPLREALPSSRFPLPNITNAPHRGLFRTGARRPLINCFLPCSPPLLCSYLTYALLLLLHTRPQTLTATVKTSGNVTSMAEPTTPDAGPNFAPPSLPPGWCVFTSPLPLHTSPASPFPA